MCKNLLSCYKHCHAYYAQFLQVCTPRLRLFCVCVCVQAFITELLEKLHGLHKQEELQNEGIEHPCLHTYPHHHGNIHHHRGNHQHPTHQTLWLHPVWIIALTGLSSLTQTQDTHMMYPTSNSVTVRYLFTNS